MVHSLSFVLCVKRWRLCLTVILFHLAQSSVFPSALWATYKSEKLERKQEGDRDWERVARSQEGPTVKEQLPPIQSEAQQRGSRGVRKMASRGERKWIIHLCIQAVSSPPDDGVLVRPRAPTGRTHLICPAGTNALISYCEAPCEPKGMLLLLFSPAFYFFFYFSLCMTDIKSKAPG